MIKILHGFNQDVYWCLFKSDEEFNTFTNYLRAYLGQEYVGSRWTIDDIPPAWKGVHEFEFIGLEDCLMLSRSCSVEIVDSYLKLFGEEE